MKKLILIVFVLGCLNSNIQGQDDSYCNNMTFSISPNACYIKDTIINYGDTSFIQKKNKECGQTVIINCKYIDSIKYVRVKYGTKYGLADIYLVECRMIVIDGVLQIIDNEGKIMSAVIYKYSDSNAGQINIFNIYIPDSIYNGIGFIEYGEIEYKNSIIIRQKGRCKIDFKNLNGYITYSEDSLRVKNSMVVLENFLWEYLRDTIFTDSVGFYSYSGKKPYSCYVIADTNIYKNTLRTRIGNTFLYYSRDNFQNANYCIDTINANIQMRIVSNEKSSGYKIFQGYYWEAYFPNTEYYYEVILKKKKLFLLNSNGDIIRTTQTDSIGYFKFNNLEFGNYFLYTDISFPEVCNFQPFEININEQLNNNQLFLIKGIDSAWAETTTLVSQITLIDSEITIFPNPVLNNFEIKGINNNFNYDVKIYTLDGKEVIHNQIFGADIINNKIEVSQLTKGMYILSIVNNQVSININFIKQ